MTVAYGTSTVKRSRRTKTEITALETAIYAVAEAEQPCTIRGVFYRVMSKGLVPKTEPGYRQVQNRILLMRRSGALPYGWISDGTRWRIKPETWSGADAALRETAMFYRRALWDDQAVHVEIWSEKDAIRSVVYPVTSEFDVPLMVARGYPSESFLWETAQAITAEGKPAIIYQLGDHDPSGVGAWDHTRARLQDFSPGVDFVFERIAVTPDQIRDHHLETRPTKTSDTRSRSFTGDSVEVDALPSPVLRNLVREAIEKWIDPHALRLTRAAEESEREVLTRIAEGWV